PNTNFTEIKCHFHQLQWHDVIVRAYQALVVVHSFCKGDFCNCTRPSFHSWMNRGSNKGGCVTMRNSNYLLHLLSGWSLKQIRVWRRAALMVCFCAAIFAIEVPRAKAVQQFGEVHFPI